MCALHALALLLVQFFAHVKAVLPNQPATPGQDSQDCGYALLPDAFQLVVRETGWFFRTGAWTSRDGGTLITWSQPLFGSSRAVYYFAWNKLFVKTREIKQVDGELGIRLPRYNPKLWTAVALMDCQDVVMYVLLSHRDKRSVYEIYNQAGQFLGASDVREENPDKLFFYGEEEHALAIAQSPQVFNSMQQVLATPNSQTIPRDPNHWGIQFVPPWATNSSLEFSQNRWVLAVAVQDLALIQLGNTQPYAVIMLLSAVFLFALAVLAYKGFEQLLHIVQRPPSNVLNPFVKRPLGRTETYGVAQKSMDPERFANSIAI